MKRLILLIALSLLAACDPHGFGFKNNPVAILEKIYEAIDRNDVDQFLNYTSREALCVYGNKEALQFLKERFPESSPIKTRASKLTSTVLNTPKFVREYWSYYREEYEVTISNKKSKEDLASVQVVCDYGREGARRDDLVNVNISRYKKRECRVSKFKPIAFEGLPLSDLCKNLKVEESKPL